MKVLKENSDIFSNFLCNRFNNSIKLSIFPEILKHADINPLQKKETTDQWAAFQIYQKYLKNACLNACLNIFSKYQCGFRKFFSIQQCLLAILEKCKRSVDNSKIFGALLTDISKAIDCLDHELLIAKPKAYRFNLTALLKLVHDYLSNRKQRKKINSSYSSFLELTFGVPQGLILGLYYSIFF